MDRYVVGWKSGASAALPTTVHVVRHGESLHNARVYSSVGADHNDERYIDAGLTTAGISQANNLSDRIVSVDPKLIVSSPLTRALDTCIRACAKLSPSPDVVVTPLCSERVAFSCDIGSHVDILERRFPSLDFSALHPREAWWWTPSDITSPNAAASVQRLRSRINRSVSNPAVVQTVEPNDVFTARVQTFRRWLVEQPFQNIAVFGHGVFLRKLLIKGRGDVVAPLQNVELRTIVL